MAWEYDESITIHLWNFAHFGAFSMGSYPFHPDSPAAIGPSKGERDVTRPHLPWRSV
jgi:hypothetical protein